MTKAVKPELVGEKPDEGPKKTISQKELDALLDAHESWLSGPMERDNLPDLSGLDLKNLTLSKRNLHQINLRGCNLENAQFHNCNLSKANLSGSILRGARFTGSDLSEVYAVNADMSNCNFYKHEKGNVHYIGEVKLIKARLNAANFTNASLFKVDLSGADIQRCTFENASLWEATLTDCVGQGANFTKTNFTFANLTNADLRMADLSKCDLHYSNLTGTDLRNVKGSYFLNDNPIRETKFSPWAQDPYSLMRRTYTGSMFFLILLLTIIALSPYILKATAWSYIGEVQISGLNYIAQDVLGEHNDKNSISRPIDNLSILSENPNFKETNVISIIVGLEENPPWFPVLITCILAIYNILRGYVTIQFSRLRDSEERSLHAPEKQEYKYLFNLHYYFLRWFVWGVFIVAIYNTGLLLFKSVYLPI